MKRLATVLAIVMVLSLSGCSQKGTAAVQDEPITLKLGHMSPLESPYNYFAEEFKRLIEERSGGDVTIDIYPAGQLGDERATLEGIQIGANDMAVATSAAMTNFVEVYEILDLPYIIDNWDHVFAWLESDAARELYEESRASGIYTLSMMPRGFRHTFNNIRPIHSPADLAGLKLRVVESSVYVDTFTAFGANAQSMAWGEVYTALQQHTIDGMENAYVTVYDYGMHEIQKYGAETGHMFAFACLNINTGVFESMSPQRQELMRACAQEAAMKIGRDQQAEEAHFKGLVEEGGIVINTVDKDAFAALVQPVYDKFTQKFDSKHLEALLDMQ